MLSHCSVINVDGVDDGAVMRMDEGGLGASTSGTNLIAAGTAAEDVARDDNDSWIPSFEEISDLRNLDRKNYRLATAKKQIINSMKS